MGMNGREIVAQQIVRMVPSLMRRISADLRCGDRGVDPSHFRLLAVLAHGSHNLSQLAKRQGVSLATMSKTAATLVERGWIERVAGRSDRRMVHFELTQLGCQVSQQIHQRLEQRVLDLLAPLSPEELESLREGLNVLQRALSASTVEESVDATLGKKCSEFGVVINLGGAHERDS